MRRTYLRLHTTSLQHCYTTTTVSSTQHSNRGSFVPLGSWLHLKPTTTARGDNSRAAPGAGPKLNTVFRTERVSVWTVCRIFLYTQIQWFSQLHWIFVFNILFVWPINIIEFSECCKTIHRFHNRFSKSRRRPLLVTRAFSWLKAATTAFTFKTLLRHYAKQVLTPQFLNVKL